MHVKLKCQVTIDERVKEILFRCDGTLIHKSCRMTPKEETKVGGERDDLGTDSLRPVQY